MKRIVIGQAGGPTAVINTSLVGFVENAKKSNIIYGAINGYEGLVKDNLIELKDETINLVQKHKFVPGACLGSGRYKLTDDKIEIAVNNLKKHNINALVFIGGNGTMAALQKIKSIAEKMDYELQVIGIPKTVDNDLGITDHAPGFASAAKFVAFSARDISKDLEAMRNFEQVRIIETMGRNAGWLAAASGLLKEAAEEGPHIVYLPETKFHIEGFLTDVKDLVKEYGTATVVVSEGIKLDNDQNIQKAVVDGRVVLGGVSQRLEELVKENLGLSARGENLGMNQRSFSLGASCQDRIEAYEVGKKAAELIDKNETNVMVTIQNNNISGYNYYLDSCPLELVASAGEKVLPSEFIESPERYYDWLRPLIGGDLSPYPSQLLGRKNIEKTYCRFK